MLATDHSPARGPNLTVLLVLVLLLALAGSLVARGAEPDAERDRKARAALALAGTAAPKVATAPAPRLAPKPYPVAYAKATADGLPLVVFVGCRAEHPRPDAVVLAHADSLPGVTGPAALVLYPAAGKLYRHAVIPCPVEEARLKAAVESARKKIDSPKVSDAAAPKPLEWDIRAEPEAAAPKVRDVRDSMVRLRRPIGAGYGTGSGTVVHRGEGWSLVLTAWHVVDGPGPLTARCDGTTYPAQVVNADRDADIALVLVSADLPAVRVAETPAAVGESVTLIGMTSIISRGPVKGTHDKNGTDRFAYAAHADSGPGDSGGGVFRGGELVGVHLGKVDDAPGSPPEASALRPVRRLLARVLADDGSLRAKPAPQSKAPQNASPAPQAGSLPAGALRTNSGRLLVPTGTGSYRYADEGPGASLPAAPVCPTGKCPLQR